MNASKRSEDLLLSLNAVAAKKPSKSPKKVTIPTKTNVLMRICLKSGSAVIILKFAIPTFFHDPVMFFIPTSLIDMRANWKSGKADKRIKRKKAGTA
jgi:hypothetical protein